MMESTLYLEMQSPNNERLLITISTAHFRLPLPPPALLLPPAQMHTCVHACSSLVSKTNYFKWKKLSFGAPISPSVWWAEITCLMEWNSCANWRNETRFFFLNLDVTLN